jgi:hypothetical protein
MIQDYRALTLEQHAQLEKQTLYAIVHAVQQYSKEAKRLFDNAPADSDSEVIVVAEDIVQYAIEVAEVYPIDERFAGFTDYKRVRWVSTPFGIIPQALLVDAKASTEDSRANLQRSQLPMDADFRVGHGPRAPVHRVLAGLPEHLVLEMNGGQLLAPTTSIFVHFYYSTIPLAPPAGPFRDLQSIIVFCIPHRRFKPIYNPDENTFFWQKGKQSDGRGEAQRIRVTLSKLSQAERWLCQRLNYAGGVGGYSTPIWRDKNRDGMIIDSNFMFKGR